MTTDRAEGIGLHNISRSQFGARYVPPYSGTLSGGSTILSFPAIALRDSIEQPEAFNTGGIIMTGLDERDATAAIQLVIARDRGAAARTATVPYHCRIAASSRTPRNGYWLSSRPLPADTNARRTWTHDD